MNVLEEYVSSDHKPLVVTFNGLVVPSALDQGQGGNTGYNHCFGTTIDWSRVDDLCIMNYKMALDSMLIQLDIPMTVFKESRLTDYVQNEIHNYYRSFMSSVMDACYQCLATKRASPLSDYIAPGWSDIVSNKHKLARNSWSLAGKPRTGPEHWLMKLSRVQIL